MHPFPLLPKAQAWEPLKGSAFTLSIEKQQASRPRTRSNASIPDLRFAKAWVGHRGAHVIVGIYNIIQTLCLQHWLQEHRSLLTQWCQLCPVNPASEKTHGGKQSSCVLVAFNCALSQPPPYSTCSDTILFHWLQRPLSMLEICVGTEKGVGSWNTCSLCVTRLGTHIRIF